MEPLKIVELVVLMLLMVCNFFSEQIAAKFIPDDEKKCKRVSLCIKIGVLCIALILFVVILIL